MAGVIQLGDAIKFAELARTVWELGWSKQHNASENYREFLADVQTLQKSLENLEGAVRRAQQSLLSLGAVSTDRLGSDRESLFEIIGDYNATLQECHQLLKDNLRYAETTGPIKNIGWNISVMPQVEHLRGRLQMHSSRIQHILKPYQIDLITNIHRDVNRRLRAMHKDIQDVKRTMNSILRNQNPGLANQIEHETVQEICYVEIPDSLLGRMGRMLGRRQYLGLPELADCFLIHLTRAKLQPDQLEPEKRRLAVSQAHLPSNSLARSAYLSSVMGSAIEAGDINQQKVSYRESASDTSQRKPRGASVPNYLTFAKCQLLIDRMKGFDELQNPRMMSHWPNYIESLEEELSAEYSQVLDEVILPDTSTLTDSMLGFWPEDEPQAAAVPTAPAIEYISLFQGYLATSSPDISRCKIELLRHSESEHRFRTIETIESYALKPGKKPEMFDFDIRLAVLIPYYADPMERSSATQRLEIMIKEKEVQHHYVFLRLQDVLEFQAAVTGFKVVDGYMETHAIAKFIVTGQEPGEDVTVQLWIPRGWTDTDDSEIDKPSSGSQSRSDSISSSHSTNTNSSSMSHTSLGSQHSVTVSVDGSSVGTGYGTIRQPPRSPLLVLFVGYKRSEAKRSIVAITLDKWTDIQRDKCKCLRFLECPITAIESSRAISARRLIGDTWDLLPLATSRRAEQYSWLGLVRVSILFPTPDMRKRFGGGPCRCPKETEGELELCHMRGHQGLFGVVRDFYRRLLIQYHEETDNLVDVVNGPPYG